MIKFEVTFKQGHKVVTTVTGKDMASSGLTLAEAFPAVLAVEQLLEKLTGLRVHIDQVFE